MSLRGLLRSSVAAACIAAVALPAVSEPAPAPRAGAPLDVRVAEAAQFSRIEFHWAGGARATTRRDGQVLTLRFNRDARPDMSRLRVFPPKWLKSAESHTVGGVLEVKLILADDADARVGQSDGATFVNLQAKPQAPGEPPKPAEAPAPVASNRPDPIPAGGVVRVAAEPQQGRLLLRFPWKAPLGAAVFRRGESVWVVFDARARMDVSQVPVGLPQMGRIQAVQGADFSAVVITSPANVPVLAQGEGGTWTVILGATADEKATPIKVVRDPESTTAALSAALAGATKVVWIDDPIAKDRIAAVTALAPSKGLASRREFVEMALLPSAQGLGVETFASDVAIANDGDLIRIARPAGMALSPFAAAAERQAATDGAPRAASMPALIDFTNWSKVGSGGFFARHDALQEVAAEEAFRDQQNQGRDVQIEARMALARFLIGSELSYEAIGVLNLLARTQPSVLTNPEFRGLRGAAKVMARRYPEAEQDFASPFLAGDPSSALWRGYIANQMGDYAEARKAFSGGYQALNLFEPQWRARFARADAESALALGDLAIARTQISMALAAGAGPLEDLYSRLTQARLFEAEGQQARALAVYDVISRVNLGSLSQPAILRATQIRLAMHTITPTQAAAVFDGLRYRWRGDATEIETIRALGQLYLGLGRHREALEAMRSAGERLPDLPQAVQLQADLSQAFRSLFLDGLADGMEPVQALGLFFDFPTLVPVGADGDLMVRKLARRLIDVDLLGQAATLLKYQMENRLEGVAKAEVATDLALVYLMDRKPEEALAAINNSRTTVLPNQLNVERRLLTGRALMQLGRLDQVLEIIEADRSPEAEDLRSEVAWRKKEWAVAGPIFERALGERWKAAGPLSAEEEAKLLRAGVAYSLAGDQPALARLRERFQGFVDQAASPDTLRVALADIRSGAISAADFSRATADNAVFASWVVRMKQKIRQRPAPVARAVRQAVRQAVAPRG